VIHICSLLLIALAALPCGKVRVNQQNQLRNCALEADVKFAGAVIPKNSIVFFTSDGVVKKTFLARDTAIAGHVCRGGGDAWETGFYPSGRLRLCWLVKEETIDTIPCRRATILADVIGGRVGVWLHETGRLAHCEAATSFTVGSCRVKKGDTVNSDAAGNISVRGLNCGRATSR